MGTEDALENERLLEGLRVLTSGREAEGSCPELPPHTS